MTYLVDAIRNVSEHDGGADIQPHGDAVRNDIVVDVITTQVATAGSVDVFANATMNLRTHGKLIISKRHHGTASQARNFIRRPSRQWS